MLHASVVLATTVFASLAGTFGLAFQLPCTPKVTTSSNDSRIGTKRPRTLSGALNSSSSKSSSILLVRSSRGTGRAWRRGIVSSSRGLSLQRKGAEGRRSSSLWAGLPAALALNPGLKSNPWYVWTLLMATSSAGLAAEKTKAGAALSSPLTTMLLTLGLCNLKLLPATSPAYDTVNKVLVPLAVPLLLFDADLRKVIKYSGTLLACFALGALGTVIGTLVAYKLVPLGMGADGWKAAAGLAARHIGGAVNFVAVAETLGMSSEAVVASLAADNVVIAAYFMFLFGVTAEASAEEEERDSEAAADAKAPATAVAKDGGAIVALESVSAEVSSAEGKGVSKESLSVALSLALLFHMTADLCAKRFFRGGVSPIPIATLFTVAAASIFPKKMGALGPVGAIVGVLFMQLFFATTGACGDLGLVMSTAPLLLLFSVVQMVVHFGFLVLTGRALRLPFRELCLASNANVGGPTTAAAMAAAKKWKSLVLPALLTGILGYATGTFVGVGLGQTVLRLM